MRTEARFSRELNRRLKRFPADATHLEQRTTGRLLRSTFWVVGMTVLLMTLVVGTTWAMYDRPLQHLAEWMGRVRTGDAVEDIAGWMRGELVRVLNPA